MTPPKTRAKQKEETRARLLRTGRRMFTERGFEATTVGALCRAARITHGALYHHFESMTALFAAVLESLTVEVADAVVSATRDAPADAALDLAFEAYLDACARPDVQAILFRDGPRVLPRARFDEIDHGTNAPMVTALLEAWIRAGVLQPVPVEVTARLLGALFAEAGAMLAEAGDAAAVREAITPVLRRFVDTLRASGA
jgi:AcrR family transcriptional regulator